MVPKEALEILLFIQILSWYLGNRVSSDFVQILFLLPSCLPSFHPSCLPSFLLACAPLPPSEKELRFTAIHVGALNEH